MYRITLETRANDRPHTPVTYWSRARDEKKARANALRHTMRRLSWCYANAGYYEATITRCERLPF